MAVRSHQELEVWQRAMELVTLIYQATNSFPADERFGLTSQVRRAAVSVPSNIAEGQGRRSTAEFIHHLSYARGSLMEVQTQIEIAIRLGYLEAKSGERIFTLVDEVGRMLNGLMNALERKTNN